MNPTSLPVLDFFLCFLCFLSSPFLCPLVGTCKEIFWHFEAFCFNKKDINVTSENGLLTIESKVKAVVNDSVGADADKEDEMIHKGISKRYFKRSFTIADDVEIKGAELKDGLLKVSMEKIIPDAKKLKTITIK